MALRCSCFSSLFWTAGFAFDGPYGHCHVNDFIRREVANGVRTDEFVKAVSWCRAHNVHEAIRAVFTSTTDVAILLAALPGMGDANRDLVRNRLRVFLDALPAEERGAYGDGYNLLVALAERLGKDAVPAFERYLKGASAQRCHSVTQATSPWEWSAGTAIHRHHPQARCCRSWSRRRNAVRRCRRRVGA